jgi:predicted dinucleotide-binding enzyme
MLIEKGGFTMNVSVIGTGRMGKGLVNILSPQVIWGSRHPEPKCQVSYEEAMNADIIIHSLWFKDVIPWAMQNKEKLAGKILVDIVNPFTEDFSDFTLDWGQSAAEELQKVVPDTIVVGAFKNTFFKIFDKPIHEGLMSDVYVTADDEAAKNAVMELLTPTPFRILDGGKLSNNRLIERFTLFEREMALRYGNYPYAGNRLFGINR